MQYEKIPILNENNFMQWLEDESFGEAKIPVTPKLAVKIFIKVSEYEKKNRSTRQSTTLFSKNRIICFSDEKRKMERKNRRSNKIF